MAGDASALDATLTVVVGAATDAASRPAGGELGLELELSCTSSALERELAAQLGAVASLEISAPAAHASYS
jgi:hypothetical protein